MILILLFAFYICHYSFFAGSMNTSKSELFKDQNRLLQIFFLFPVSLFCYLIIFQIPLFSIQRSIFYLSSYSQTLAQLNFRVTRLENNMRILDTEDFIKTGIPLSCPPGSKLSYTGSGGNLSSPEDIFLYQISLVACILSTLHLIVNVDFYVL